MGSTLWVPLEGGGEGALPAGIADRAGVSCEYPYQKGGRRGHMPAGITLTELVEKMLWLRQLIKERGGRVSPFRVEAAHEVEQPFRPTSCVA